VPLSRSLTLALTLLATAAAARPWQGITPGASNNLDVIGKFGEPSKIVTANGRQTLVYSHDVAIKGTVQAQFKLDAEKLVERIDVFPAVKLEAAAIEASYGPRCDPRGSNEPCYVEKRSPSKLRYFAYAKMGLAVFFEEDEHTVKYLVFLPAQATP
jgi:hypothetical protein